MKAGESRSGHGLSESPYPNELRADGGSITLVDADETTYLLPIDHHDFELTSKLVAAHLTSSTVEQIEGHGLAQRFGRETDLLPLPSLFNAITDNRDALNDIKVALCHVAHLLKDLESISGAGIETPKLDMFAIDRATARAELLAPYAGTQPMPEAAHATYAELAKRTISQAASEGLREVVEQSFSEVESQEWP